MCKHACIHSLICGERREGRLSNAVFLRAGMMVVKLDRRRTQLTFKIENSL